MNDREIMKLVEERIEDFEYARKDLTKLKMQHPEVYSEIVRLTSIYNDNWDAIKNLLKAISSPDGLRIGAFSRDRKTEKVRYKPSLLPSNVLIVEGVVKDVDDKRIADLVASGAVKQEDVEAAKYPYSKAPSVRSGDLKRASLPTLIMAE